MDLFDDLPPATDTPTKVDNSAASLFDDIPPASENEPAAKRKTEDIESDDVKRPKVSTVRYSLRGFIGERRGERVDMQDAHVILDNLLPLFSTQPKKYSRMAYYGVFDGHAGPRASQFAADHLHKNIVSRFPKGTIQNHDREVKMCLIDSFKKTDTEFLQKASAASPSWKDGTTAVCVLLLDETLYVANLGDSKVVLCRKEGDKKTHLRLSKDHSPAQFEERQRIQKAGGTVREGRVMGVLEVSRSIGDGRFKHCGIINTPDVVKCPLGENDQFLVLACDGLWKVFGVEEAVKYISDILEDDSVTLPEGK
ncbi:integrin-linked kinase-associated serine/threonine phosphatase 2C-like isoform X2 [Dysidea avara]|uniref:integrin-linked kinase-associated serine/threonine phosphatase 2C-like isoform X2 n=1 Tax=Dysidea avara TaxID=196820 RepID=UPI00331BD889